MHSMIRSDIMIKASGEMPSEAAGFTPFVADVAQCVSPMVKELDPLLSADAVQWVDHWAAAGMFKGKPQVILVLTFDTTWLLGTWG